MAGNELDKRSFTGNKKATTFVTFFSKLNYADRFQHLLVLEQLLNSSSETITVA